MGHDSVSREKDPAQARRSEWIETFRSRSRCDLRSGWHRVGVPKDQFFVAEPWGREHRPDWVERGLLVWPRGRQWLRLEQRLTWPAAWDVVRNSRARLSLSWWAERMRLWVNNTLVHEGDLFDTACRWAIPDRFRDGGDELRLILELCSPCHDDGALIESALCLEPHLPEHDPDGVRAAEALLLHLEAGGELPSHWQQLDPSGREALAAVQQQLSGSEAVSGSMHWVGHAHLDLAWLWPVAETWQAAERTFRSVLALMQSHPELRFAHSTPALYAWLQQHRPALFEAVRKASVAGRWEPINGPWVETDCVLVSTASLWQQFQLGQDYSREVFPEWSHQLAWLPDSFGFGAGLPAVAARTGVRWFCTHKLAWNAENPFPHRLFRWRSRGGFEVLSLMLPPIGRRGDPLEILREQRVWQRATGLQSALWIPGVGDHGGGPTEEMLDQMRLWDPVPQALPRQSGSVRSFLALLEPQALNLPVWRDELYLELHRGCATSRPDQKRHNRSLERLLREADACGALLRADGDCHEPADWRPLLFHQFHDILPGTSIPEVFEQAEPVWRSARRRAKAQRDALIRRLLSPDQRVSAGQADHWAWIGLQPLASWSPLLRLPFGRWSVGAQCLVQQPAFGGGVWVQLPRRHGMASVALHRNAGEAEGHASVRGAVNVVDLGQGIWRIGNGLVEGDLSSVGLLQLRDGQGRDQLAEPLQFRRFRDRDQFWDAWDLAADYRTHPLDLESEGSLQWLERGPLVAHAVLRFRAGLSRIRLDLRLRADCRWLELIASIDWQQTHELLRLDLPLAASAVRFAADTSGGVLERPARACSDRERARWEVPTISWLASQVSAPGGGLAVLLDGPQGVDGEPDRMGISLLRGPTWPEPSADHGSHRLRFALMPLSDDWSRSGVPQAAIAFREPGWWGSVEVNCRQTLLPALPETIVPISIHGHPEGVLLRVINPGASRCIWEPGSGWTVRRVESSQALATVMLAPGELIELIVCQSSWSSNGSSNPFEGGPKA